MRKFYVFALTGAFLALAASTASAQRRLTGRVTSTTGEPLASAAVTVQGTPFTAFSGEDGRFVLANVGEGAKVLVVRRIGYKRTNVAVPATQNDVEVKIEKDVLQLEKVVITGAVTSVSSANAAQSVTSLSAEQIVRAPTPMLENALQGKIPGALVTTNSGAPGGGSQVQLRGISSINANAQPLYVVDGVIVSNAQVAIGLNSVTNAGGGINSSQDQMVNRIADINPDDIETLEVLKGASAGAIYGSRAAAGVIVITTKRGQSGRPAMSATQRLGQFSLSKHYGTRCFGSEAEAMAWAGVSSAAQLASPWSPVCHDFEKEYYSGNDMSYETDLSARGGTASGTTFFINGLAKRDNAIGKSTYYAKHTLTANIGQVIGSRTNLRVNNNFAHSLTDRGVHGNDNSPIVSPGDIFSGTPSFFNLSSGARNPWITEGTNPWQTAAKLRAPEEVFRYIGSAHATFNAYSSTHQSLDLNLQGGVDAYHDAGRITSPADLYFEPADGLPGSVIRSDATSTQAGLTASGVHKWITSYGTATTSFGLRKERRDFDQMLNRAQNVPAGAQNVILGAVQSQQEGITLIKDFAYFLQEEFLALDDRLFLTLSTNSERSSVNGDENKFYSYPKYAASYRLPWLPPAAQEIKLRVAYGRAGNQPPFGYKFTALTTGVNDGLLGGRPSTVAGNPVIKPELSSETEGGVDAQFFDGRMAVTATYFKKNVDDLILAVSTAPSTGFTTKYLNGGKLSNEGSEFSLDVTPLDQSSGLQWISHTTFAQVHSLIKKLEDCTNRRADGTCTPVPAFRPGVGSFGTSYGSPWIQEGQSATMIQVRGECRVGGVPTGPTAGALNASGRCPSANRVNILIESAPKYTMGFGNSVNWNQFSLYGLLDWRKGGKAVNLTNNYWDETGLLQDTLKAHVRDSLWRAAQPVYVEDAGFLKLRELSLSYRLPQKLTADYFTFAKDVRLELAGRNLWTKTKYTGYDPEVSNFSNQNLGRFQDVTPYPASRSWFFSLSANF